MGVQSRIDFAQTGNHADTQFPGGGNDMAHAQYNGRKLGVKLGVAIATAAMVLSTGAAYADLGDQLAKLLAEDGAAGDSFGNSVAIS